MTNNPSLGFDASDLQEPAGPVLAPCPAGEVDPAGVLWQPAGEAGHTPEAWP